MVCNGRKARELKIKKQQNEQERYRESGSPAIIAATADAHASSVQYLQNARSHAFALALETIYNPLLI